MTLEEYKASKPQAKSGITLEEYKNSKIGIKPQIQPQPQPQVPQQQPSPIIEEATNKVMDMIKRGSLNEVKEKTPEQMAQLKEDSKKRQEFQKKADAGYYGMKTMAGIGNAVEGITDAAQLIGGKYVATPAYKGLEAVTSLGGKAPNKVSEALGKVADYSWDIRPKEVLKDDWSQEVQDLINKQYKTNAVERFAGDALGGVAGMAPTIAANIAMPGLGYATLGLQGAGSGVQDAYQKTGELGAKEQIYGALSGLSEVAIEKVSGGIGGLGKGVVDDVARKLIKNGFVRAATGEGIEEAISTFVDPYLKRLTYDKEAKGGVTDVETWKEAVRSALIGSLTSMVLQGGQNISTSINTSMNTNQDTKALPKMDKSTSNLLKKLDENIAKGESAPLKAVKNVLPQDISNTGISKFASANAAPKYNINNMININQKSETPRTALSEMQDVINEIVPVATGKFRQKAYGIYKNKSEIIRIKEKNDIPVAMHELSHHIDKIDGLSKDSAYDAELIPISRIEKTNKSLETKRKEGVAEFGRYYMTDPAYAKEIAPKYYDAFENTLKKDPAMEGNIKQLQKMMNDYLTQSPTDRMLSHIDFGDEEVSLWGKVKTKGNDFIKNFRKNYMDDLDPLKKIINDITSGEKIDVEKDPYALLRLNKGATGKVRAALEYGILDVDGKKISKSLKEIVEPVKENMDNFTAYLSALRAKDLQARGIETGFNAKDVDAILNENAANEKFKNAADELYKFQDIILIKTLVKSGIISAKDVAGYKINNPHYIPFNRVMDENFKQSKDSMAKANKKIRGSTRDIINPLESIIKNVYSFTQLAEKNDAFKSLFDLAETHDGTGKWFDKVPTDMKATQISGTDIEDLLSKLDINTEGVDFSNVFTTIFRPANYQKGNVITVMRNGKPVHYEIMDKELYDILSPEMKNNDVYGIAKLMQMGATALRVGATHTAEFPIRNVIRDTFDAGVYSKNGFTPVIDSIRGMFEITHKTDLYYKWLENGGLGSTYTNAQRKTLQNTLKGVLPVQDNRSNTTKFLDKTKDLTSHPLRNWLDFAGSVSELFEEGTRVGEFRKALKKGKSFKESAYDSRNITLDFSKGGKEAKAINKYVAFFNAKLQGLDKTVEAFRERPVQTTIKGLAYTLPLTMLQYLVNDDDEWEKIPQWEKDVFWIYFIGDTPIKIPKPQGAAFLFTILPQRAIDFIKSNDKDAFEEITSLLIRLSESYAPIEGSSSIIPTGAKPILENLMNYNTFRQQPIINQNLSQRSPQYQYDDNTSGIAKSIGGLVNYSPKKIDNLISGYGGNLGRDIGTLAGIPISLLKGEGITGKDGNSLLRTIPLVKGFIANDNYDKETDEFYNELNELRTKKANVKATNKPMNQADEKRLSELEKQYRENQKAKKK